MCKKLIYLVSFVLVLGISSNTLADLVDHWKFDEGSGTTAFNSVAGGTDGTINGATWANDPVRGVVLSFDGINDEVNIVGYNGITGGAPRTVCLWINTVDAGGDAPNGRGLGGWGTPDPGGTRWELVINKGGGGRTFDALRFNGSGGGRNGTGTTVLTDSTWHHVAVTLADPPQGTSLTIYVDGMVETITGSALGTQAIDTGIGEVRIGNGVKTTDSLHYAGLIDDVRIYDHALTQAEILFVIEEGGEGYPYALGPNPTDGALYEDTWVNLRWQPGDSAVSHDVYIGDNFEDVNDGAEATFVGNQAATNLIVGFPGFPYPDGLVPGTTYYWRIDEVNDTDPNSPWKGNIWSFSIPPKTAYWPDPADGAESVETDVELSWTAGFGSKLHTVYFGDNFDDVNNDAGGLPQSETTYTPGPLKLAKTYYWRVDEFDAIDTYKGDVWSFTTEGAVGNPNPSNGAVDVEQTPVLTWTPGVYADSHQVYFGTDKDVVKNADTSSPEYKGTGNLGSESYDPGKLSWDTTYYWRIDEANNVNPDSPWTGSLWNFTTTDFIAIEDFEDYNDYPPDEIFSTWIDGYGTTTNGSTAGYAEPDFLAGEHYVETTILHDGSQSMPLFYENNFKYSEATMTLTQRDWTEEGVGVLSLWFRGDASNAAERMYVALNGSAVVYHDNPNAAQIDTWTEWTIDLQEFAAQGVNLANVNTIAIGFGDKNNLQAGGSGMVFFDNIRLYRPAEPEPEPVP